MPNTDQGRELLERARPVHDATPKETLDRAGEYPNQLRWWTPCTRSRAPDRSRHRPRVIGGAEVPISEQSAGVDRSEIGPVALAGAFLLILQRSCVGGEPGA
jgi:hypothetical protein